MYDIGMISTFIHQVDDEIAIEAFAVSSSKILIAIKKVLNAIRHAITRMGYRVKSMRRYQIPKEISRSIQRIVDLSSDLLDTVDASYSAAQVEKELNKIYQMKEYKILFDKKPSDYSRDAFMSVDAKAVSANLIKADKQLSRLENEIMTLSRMDITDRSGEQNERFSLQDRINSLQETTKVLSLKIQVLSKYFTFGRTITGEEIPLGQEFDAEIVHY